MVVRLEAVAKRYGDGPEVLSELDLSLDPGGFYFLTGASGSGKTTLLRLLYLSERPTRGRVMLFGQNVAGVRRNLLPSMRRRIGVVFQDFRLIASLTAFDNVALPLRVAGMRETPIREQVTELLNWVGLGKHLQSLPSTLSGGQQQRVAIARAVIARPQLLLADEPTGNVDDEIGMRLLHLFEELNRLGSTVVVATHNFRLIEQLPYPVISLENGKCVTRFPGEAA
jgi:cell division transport system ATP-binding protein